MEVQAKPIECDCRNTIVVAIPGGLAASTRTHVRCYVRARPFADSPRSHKRRATGAVD